MPEETIAYHDPNALVQTDWLEAHLRRYQLAHLRLYDAFAACRTRHRYSLSHRQREGGL